MGKRGTQLDFVAVTENGENPCPAHGSGHCDGRLTDDSLTMVHDFLADNKLGCLQCSIFSTTLSSPSLKWHSFRPFRAAPPVAPSRGPGSRPLGASASPHPVQSAAPVTDPANPPTPYTDIPIFNGLAFANCSVI
uniref:HDC02259 n=1 Tax=Drosophila melanogaster TaxID=7227 RepID=Q6IHL4_DROME|nr:TPA_inf: HDC02259 [Drosophila melanogaster]